MLTLSTPSLTWVFAHPARSSSSLVTSCPPSSTKRRSTANAFGVRATTSSAAHELLVGEIQGKALERQASICFHRRGRTAFSPLSNRNLTPVPSCAAAPRPYRRCHATEAEHAPIASAHGRTGPGSNCHPTAPSYCTSTRAPSRRDRVIGRVEHVTSGRVDARHLAAELVAFLAEVLGDGATGD